MSHDETQVPKYGGVVAVLPTLCRAPGEIDPAATAALAGRLAGKGCHGVFVLGSTGQAALLDEDDRRALTAAVAQAAAAQSRIYVGVTGLGVKHSQRLARYAAKDGGHAAVAMTPMFLRLSQPELRDYFLALADASAIPIVLYHHQASRTPIDPQTVAALASHANIVGMKESDADTTRLHRILEVAAKSLAVFPGGEKVLLEAMRAGAAGSATALAAIVPEWCVGLDRAARRGDQVTAERFQAQIVQLWQMFTLPWVSESISGFVYTLTAALRRRQWIDPTYPLMSGYTPPPAFIEALDTHLDRCGIGPELALSL